MANINYKGRDIKITPEFRDSIRKTFEGNLRRASEEGNIVNRRNLGKYTAAYSDIMNRLESGDIKFDELGTTFKSTGDLGREGAGVRGLDKLFGVGKRGVESYAMGMITDALNKYKSPDVKSEEKPESEDYSRESLSKWITRRNYGGDQAYADAEMSGLNSMKKRDLMTSYIRDVLNKEKGIKDKNKTVYDENFMQESYGSDDSGFIDNVLNTLDKGDFDEKYLKKLSRNLGMGSMYEALMKPVDTGVKTEGEKSVSPKTEESSQYISDNAINNRWLNAQMQHESGGDFNLNARPWRSNELREKYKDIITSENAKNYIPQAEGEFGGEGSPLLSTAFGPGQFLNKTYQDLKDRGLIDEGSKRNVMKDARTAQLAYMQNIGKEYDGDIMKTLAAYHDGPQALKEAIARAKEKGTDWKTELSDEGQKYLGYVKDRYDANKFGEKDEFRWDYGLTPNTLKNEEIIKALDFLNDPITGLAPKGIDKWTYDKGKGLFSQKFGNRRMSMTADDYRKGTGIMSIYTQDDDKWNKDYTGKFGIKDSDGRSQWVSREFDDRTGSVRTINPYREYHTDESISRKDKRNIAEGITVKAGDLSDRWESISPNEQLLRFDPIKSKKTSRTNTDNPKSSDNDVVSGFVSKAKQDRAKFQQGGSIPGGFEAYMSSQRKPGSTTIKDSGRFEDYSVFDDDTIQTQRRSSDLETKKDVERSGIDNNADESRLFADDYEWTAADNLDVAALGTDLTGLIAGLSGVGSVASAGLGATATTMSLGADYMRAKADDDITAEEGWDMAKTAIMGYGMDAIAAIPGLGIGADVAKTTTRLGKMGKTLQKLVKIAGVAGGVSGMKTLSEYAFGEKEWKDATVSDLREIMNGISLGIHATRAAGNKMRYKNVGTGEELDINITPKTRGIVSKLRGKGKWTKAERQAEISKAYNKAEAGGFKGDKKAFKKHIEELGFNKDVASDINVSSKSDGTVVQERDWMKRKTGMLSNKEALQNVGSSIVRGISNRPGSVRGRTGSDFIKNVKKKTSESWNKKRYEGPQGPSSTYQRGPTSPYSKPGEYSKFSEEGKIEARPRFAEELLKIDEGVTHTARSGTFTRKEGNWVKKGVNGKDVVLKNNEGMDNAYLRSKGVTQGEIDYARGRESDIIKPKIDPRDRGVIADDRKIISAESPSPRTEGVTYAPTIPGIRKALDESKRIRVRGKRPSKVESKTTKGKERTYVPSVSKFRKALDESKKIKIKTKSEPESKEAKIKGIPDKPSKVVKWDIQGKRKKDAKKAKSPKKGMTKTREKKVSKKQWGGKLYEDNNFYDTSSISVTPRENQVYAPAGIRTPEVEKNFSNTGVIIDPFGKKESSLDRVGRAINTKQRLLDLSETGRMIGTSLLNKKFDTKVDVPLRSSINIPKTRVSTDLVGQYDTKRRMAEMINQADRSAGTSQQVNQAMINQASANAAILGAQENAQRTARVNQLRDRLNAETKQEALRDSEIAFQNASMLAQKANRERQLENQKRVAVAQPYMTSWQNKNQELKDKLQTISGIRSNIASNINNADPNTNMLSNLKAYNKVAMEVEGLENMARSGRATPEQISELKQKKNELMLRNKYNTYAQEEANIGSLYGKISPGRRNIINIKSFDEFNQ